MKKLRFKFLQKDIFIYQDVEYVRQLRSNPAIHYNFFLPKKITQVEQEYWFNNTYVKEPDNKIWIAYDESCSQPIGFVNIKIDSIIHRRVEFNYAIEPMVNQIDYYDRIIKFSIRQSKQIDISMHKLFTHVRLDNIGRLKELSGNGFKVDGILLDHIYVNGKYEHIYLVSRMLS